MKFAYRVASLAVVAAGSSGMFFLSGCALSSTSAPTADTGLAITGNVQGGQQPIAGAHVYLFAANTTGYGNASVSLLTNVPGSTTLDTSGGATNGDYFVTTDANGGFNITGDYSCTPNTQVYLYALGGNPGLATGTNNASLGLMTVLGNCPSAGNFLAGTPFIMVNEVSTVAAAYAMAGFATDATHVSSSGTALAKVGIANAFANASNLVVIWSGFALTTTPEMNGTVPQGKIYLLADILATCVNSNGAVTGPTSPSACYTLLSTATSDGTSAGIQPTDTATAAINIAHHPAANVAALYALPPARGPFYSGLTSQPNDFMITIQIVGGGLIAPCGVAIDAGGNAWAYDCQRSVVARFSSLGAMLSGDQGYSTGIANASSIAIDRSGNAWIASSSSSTDNVIELSPSGVPSSWSPYSQSGLYGHLAIDGLGDAWLANYSNPSVTEISSSGSILSGTSGYTGGGLDQSAGVAVDGSGSVWITNQGNGSVTKLSNSGAILSGANGFTSTFNGRQGIAIDSSGNAWVAIYAGVLELSNTGTVLSGANGYQSFPYEGFSAVALDGSGNAWVGSSDTGYGSLAEFSNSGTLLSGASGYTGDSNLRTYFFYPAAVAIDGSGDVWAANSYGGVDEFIGAATPVITPIMAGLPPTPTSNGSSNLATRP